MNSRVAGRAIVVSVALLAGLGVRGAQKPPRAERDAQTTLMQKSSTGRLSRHSPIGQISNSLEAGSESTTHIRHGFRGNRHILMMARDGSLFALRAGESDDRIPLPLPLHPTETSRIVAPGLGPFLRTTQVLVEGSEQASERVNYYYGRNVERDIPVFEKVRYDSLYPGIDLLYSVDELGERFEFFVAEGANFSVIEFAPENFEVRDGALRLRTEEAFVDQPPPLLIQGSTMVALEFEDTMLESVRFRARGHEPAKPARIVLERFSQMSSRQEGERKVTPMSADGSRVVVDSQGFIYLVSQAETQGTFRGTRLWDSMIGYLQEFKPEGMAIVKIGERGVPLTTTYVGGAMPPYAVTIDERDSIYVAATEGVGVPLSKDPRGRKVPAGGVPVLFRIDKDSTLGFCERILANGPLHVGTIDVTQEGRLLIAGSAAQGALSFQGGYASESTGDATGEDAFLISAQPSSKGQMNVTYAARFGGSGRDRITAVRGSGDGTILVAGFTCSPDFPLADHRRSAEGSVVGCLAFVARFRDQGGSESLVSSFRSPDEYSLPSTQTDPVALALTPSGAIVVAASGMVDSAPDPSGDRRDVWVWILDSALSKIRSSFRTRGNGSESLVGMDVDRGGSVYIVGSTSSTDFPQRLSAYPDHADGEEHLFAAKINPILSGVVWSTYLSGSALADSRDFGLAVGPHGEIFVTTRSNWLLRAPESAPLALAVSRIDGGIVEIRSCTTCPAGPVVKTIDRESEEVMIHGVGFSNDSRVLVDGVLTRSLVQDSRTIRLPDVRFPSAATITVLNSDQQGWSGLLAAESKAPVQKSETKVKPPRIKTDPTTGSLYAVGVLLVLLAVSGMARSRWR